MSFKTLSWLQIRENNYKTRHAKKALIWGYVELFIFCCQQKNSGNIWLIREVSKIEDTEHAYEQAYDQPACPAWPPVSLDF